MFWYLILSSFKSTVDENVCLSHDERIKHFCRDCNELICAECVLDSHLGHKSSKLEKTLAKDLGAKLRKIVESVSDEKAADRMLEVFLEFCFLC